MEERSLLVLFLGGSDVFVEVEGLVVTGGGAFGRMARDGFAVSLEVGRLVTGWGSSFDCIGGGEFMGPPARRVV
jgi:hypothetical protein